MATHEKEPYKIAASDYANMSCWLKILADSIQKLASNKFSYEFVSIETSDQDIVSNQLQKFISTKYDGSLFHRYTIWVDAKRAKDLQACLRIALKEACQSSWPFYIGAANTNQVELFYNNKNIKSSMLDPGIPCMAMVSPLPKIRDGNMENVMMTIVVKCEVPLELHETTFIDKLKQFFKRKKKLNA